MRPRKLVVPGAVAVAATTALVAQAAYAVHRNLPRLDELDPSGVFGDPDLPPLKLVVLGDSTITGPGLSHPDEIWVRRAAHRLSDRYHITLTSLAVGGARARDVLDDQVPVAVELRPDLAFVSVGGNDIIRRTPLRLLERQLTEIVEQLTMASRAVVLSGIGDLGTIPRLLFPLRTLATGRARLGDRIHLRVAERAGQVNKIPIWELTTEAFRSHGKAIFSADLFHPNAAGHTLWAEAALPTLENVLATLAGTISPAPAQ